MALTKINTNLIANNTIAVTNIADNAVDATKIASNSILTRHIDDDQVTGDQLADNITIAGTLTSTGTITGTLATAAQTNITSLGSLTALTGSAAPFVISNTSNGNNIDIKTTSSNSLVHAIKIHSGGVFEAKQGAVFNEDSNDVDFRVESNGNASMLFVDGGNDRVGIGTSSPATTMHLYEGASGVTTSATNILTIENDGNARMSLNAPHANDRIIFFGNPKDNGGNYIIQGGTEAGTYDNDYLKFIVGNRTVMTMLDGNVGIGISSPNGRLEVREGASDFDPESHIIISNDDIADGDLMGILFKQRNENDGKAWFGTERMGDYGVSDFVFLTDSVGDDNAVAATDEKMRITYTGNVVPGTTSTQDLGSNSLRWANLYTGDLHLSNEGSEGNEVDGTSGDWTIQEGDEHLYIKNNKSGKKYRFALEEIE